jgi:glutamyl-tRNA reductase
VIVVVGISYRTAPIEVRERAALAEAEVPSFLQGLVGEGSLREAFVVSTCNRVEVIAAPTSPSTEALEDAARTCARVLCARTEGLDRYVYMHMGQRAVEHLFRVASSLDSLVLGEPQILGQLKQGFELGRKSGTLGPVLHRAVPRAVRAAKRVRTETTIGTGQVSVPTVAVDLATQIFSDLAGRNVVLLGAGEMGRGVARLLADLGARIVVLGRRLEAAERLAEEVNGEAKLIDVLPDALALADIVVSSTSSTEPVISEALVRSVRRARRGRNLFLIDLAVPRDVEPGVGQLDGTFLYNIDDLSHVVEQSMTGRRREAEQAQRILDEETRGFERWAEAEQATPLIKALRARLRLALEVELEKSLRGRLRDLDGEQRAALVKMLDASINRMLHLPTARLREEATSDEEFSLPQLGSTLEELFRLSEVDASSLDAPGVKLPLGDFRSTPPSSGSDLLEREPSSPRGAAR